MDRDDIVNLYIVSNIPLPQEASSTSDEFDDDIPF
jgi:hypothetical protein